MRIRTYTINIIVSLIAFFILLSPMKSNAADYTPWLPIFDPAYYVSHNSEAASYAGGNVDMLWSYFVTVGIPRGDQASEEFNVYVYASNYPSLNAQFGGDMISYYIHYATEGKKMGLNARTPLAPNNIKKALPTDYPGIIYSNGQPVIGVNGVIRVTNPNYGVWASGTKKVEVQSGMSARFAGQIYGSNECMDPIAAVYGNVGGYKYFDTVATPFGNARIYKKISVYDRESYFNWHYEAFIKTDRGYIVISYIDTAINRVPSQSGNARNFSSRKNTLYAQVSDAEGQNFKQYIIAIFAR